MNLKLEELDKNHMSLYILQDFYHKFQYIQILCTLHRIEREAKKFFLPNFHLKKYEFKLHKGFFILKKDEIYSPNFKKKFQFAKILS